MMKNILSPAIVLTCIILNTSCNNTKKAAETISKISSNALFQSEWKLAEVQGAAVPEVSLARLVLTPGQPNKVTGSTGCNIMTGSFTLGGADTIKFSPMAVTRRACLDEGAGKTEQQFTDALSKVTSWRVTGNVLELKNAGTVVAKFNGQRPATANELKLNGTWELTYISGPKIAFDGLFPNRKPSILFVFPAPEASGFSGCNGYSCKVKVDGSKISFSDALHTMMYCEGGGEQEYFKVLKTVTSYGIEGNVLTMNMGDVPVMKFTKK
ncbi:MAG: META domain-containing protein [Ferruginibacter sp.]